MKGCEEFTKAKKKTIEFFNNYVLSGNGQSGITEVFGVNQYRKAMLNLEVTKIGNPSGLVRVQTQFGDDLNGPFYDYQNGPFGYMIWRDTAIPAGTAGLRVATTGDCVGFYQRCWIWSSGTLNAANHFVVDVDMDYST